MKKSLIALAIFGAFTGTAFAQSNVTLYGVVDGGLQYNKVGGSGDNTGSQFGVDGGYVFGNRWGLRGSEALGNGLNAIFTLESGFNIDTGTSAQGNRLFGRQAFAGLSGGFGSVVFGRIATFSSGTGAFDMFGNVDPFGTGWGINSLGSTFLSAGASVRADNTVAYVTPTWGGFKAGVAYSFKADSLACTAGGTATNSECPGASNNTRVLALGASYAAGPLYAAVTYDSIAFSPLQITGNADAPDQKHLQVGASWDFGFLKVGAGYADQSNVQTLLPGGYNDTNKMTVPAAILSSGGFDASSYMVGVTVPLFGGNVLGSWQKFDGDSRTVGAVTFDPKFSVYSVGYGYPLSQRTSLYAGYGKRTADGNLPATFERQQAAFGMSHRF